MKKYALLPALAADLARELAGHEADPVLAGEALSFAPITLDDWNRLIVLLASKGDVKRKAIPASGLSPALLQRYIDAEPELRRQFDEARRHWKQYRGWGFLEVEEILDDLARGERTLQSTCYARGWDRNKYLRLLYLIGRSPEVEQRYHLAKKAQLARVGGRLFEEGCAASTKKQAREISSRMDLIRRRMPHKVREVYHRERTPIESARRRAGLRMNGKKRKPEEKTS